MRRVLLALCVLTGVSAVVAAESAAGVKWTAPKGWVSEAQRPMRAATYSIPPDVFSGPVHLMKMLPAGAMSVNQPKFDQLLASFQPA